MTKRKSSRIDPTDRFRNQNSKYHCTITNPNYPSRKDFDGREKVMLAAPEKGSHSSHGLEDSYTPAWREKVTTYTNPKTSEYAFFKKLKKDAGLRVHSHPVQKDADQPKKPESSDCCRERTSDVGVDNKGFNSSRIIKDTSTVKTESFFSPSDGAWNNSDAYSMSIMQNEFQSCGGTFEPQGNQFMHGETFSRKREKLHQCVADALFPDTEKLCSKGHGIVSVLLSRLFPTSIHENDPNPGKAVNATTEYDLLDSQELDSQFKEPHQKIPTRKLLELESSSYFTDHLLSPMLLRSEDRIAPHAEFPNPGNVVNATTGCGLLDSQEVEAQFKEHHQIPIRKLLEFESSSDFSDHLLSPMFLTSNERLAPYAEFQTSHFHKYYPLYSITEPEWKFSGNPSFSAKSDASVRLLYNEVLDATRNGLLDSRESDARFKEHHQTPKTKLIEFESNSYIKDHLLSPILRRSNGRIIPHTDFHTSHSLKFLPLHSITEPGCEFGGAPSFDAMSDATLGFLFNEQNHEILTSDYFKDPGKLERDPIPLLLEKDFECTADEINLPISYKYAKPDTVHALSTLGNGEEQMLKNILGEYHFQPSSFQHSGNLSDSINIAEFVATFFIGENRIH
ncbi:hypothetical protein Lalb_Chr02g0152931 [Lupinus albus]|uniref:Uncharacterized protein n=1 Tax=Lupinus albus TaxID=3870 RepID=A0A6A4QZY1_LUPAL|nr:hypothetical protein Lalb_Chr02g0152931 [Lupinus albus]